MSKTIRVREETYNALNEIGSKGQSYDDIIVELIKTYTKVIQHE